MKILSLVLGVFIVIVLGLSYFLYNSFQNAQQAKEASHWINHTYQVIEKLDKIETAVFEYESAIRGFAISGHSKFIANAPKKKAEIVKALEDLKELVTDNPIQLANIENLEKHMSEKIAFHDRMVEQYQVDPNDARDLIESYQAKELGDSVKIDLFQMRYEERRLLDIRTKYNRQLTNKKLVSSFIGAGAAFIIFAVTFILIVKENKLKIAAEKATRESELKYKGLVENTAMVVTTVDKKGNFSFVSNNSMALCGFSPEELSGRYFTHIVVPGWKETVALFYFDQLKKGVHQTTYTFPIQTKEGQEKWIEQTAILLWESSDSSGFQCFIKDVTEKIRTDALLEEARLEMQARQEEYQFRLQSILDNIPMIVYLKDLEGRFIMVNKEFREALSISDEMILGKTAFDLKGQDSVYKRVSMDEEVKELLIPIEIEDTIVTRKGIRNMLVTKFPLFDKNNKLFAICGIDKDITDMVRNRNELVTARQRAENAERLQEEFLANMSHEIRTPMNGIIGMTHLLSDSGLDKTQQEYVQIIKHSSDSLLVLINDILDLSKIKAGRMSVEEIDFSIRDVIAQVTLPMQIRTAEKGLKLSTNIDDRLPDFVWGDQHKLIQIFNNLLGNAIKFTNKGDIAINVRVCSKTDYIISILFEVKDSGIGIAPHKLDAIFESFVQAGNDMVRRFGGTGLGLAITKRLVELQGGTIMVESKEGEGSVFSFTINYGRSEKKADPKHITAMHDFMSAGSLKGYNILVVEDNEVNQKVIRNILKKFGIEVQLANNGKEAISVLNAGNAFDLIIMDLQMPEMDGIQASAYIRNKLNMATPIIAMTASALRNEKQKCLELGINEYVTKPFAPAEIMKHIARLLQNLDGNVDSLPTHVLPSDRLYDLQYLHEMDDADYVREILSLFLENTPKLLEEIKVHAMHEEWENVSLKAHKIKSSLGILQATRMLDYMSSVEQMANEKNQLEKVPGLIEKAIELFKLLQPMLQAEMAEAI